MTDRLVRTQAGPRDDGRGPAWSPSRLELVLGCSAAFMFRYILKRPSEPRAPMEIGNWMDDVLNVAWTHRQKYGVPQPTKEIVEYARSTFGGYEARVTDWQLATHPADVMDRLLLALEEYMVTWARRLRPLDVQPWVEVPAGIVGRLRVRGIPDLLAEDPQDPGLWVVDHKAKGVGWYPAKTGPQPDSASELRRNIKMMMYAVALAETKRVPVGVRWIGLIYTATPQVQTVEVRITDKIIAWAIHAAQGAAAIIESGVYKPNPTYTWCPTCEYGKECESTYGTITQ